MNLRVIIVDPDEGMLKLLTILVRRMGHEVVALKEPTSCPVYSNESSKCGQNHPCGDLLILNNQLHKNTGLKLIDQQARGGCKAAPRNKLVLSASSNSEAELQYAKEIGCQVIKKPFHLDDIKKWIDATEKLIAPNRKLAELL
ncbi:MAG: hypothetical protein C0624_04790 [Desulfuromonas sp.]|nr:MAG: hypothetical protein C0624_04790 [Desulfuromonas sp.]